MREKRLLTLLCLCVAILLGAKAQNKETLITLSVNGESLPTALGKVERQSGYYKINYDFDAANRYKVTANIKQKTAPQAVQALLKGLPFNSTVQGRIIKVMPRNGAVVTAKGRVFDSDGEPLMGATVKLKGSDSGVVTDINGNYTLANVPEGDVLMISYIGKQTVEYVVGRKNIEVILEDESTVFNDVIVTGYQQISKERVTGSFDKVTSKELEARPTADLSSALQGMVAGMQATENEDGTVDFSIRGQSTLYANASPLVVVDGFPIDGDFSTINPNDVESVTVLKDAAAASIWGARSANGVIVVTTKSGRSKKLEVNGKAFWRITTTPDLDYILNQADSKTTVDYEIMANKKGWDMGYAYAPSFDNLYGTSLSLAQEYYFANLYYGMSDAEMNAGLDKLRNRSNRQQLKDYLMQTALLQQYNVSVKGGTDKMDNYVSLMYEKNDERTIKRGYERFMLNYNSQIRFNKHITASIGATMQKRETNKTGVTLQEFGELSPYEMIVNEDGSYADQLNTYNRFELSKIDLSQFPYSDFSYNMLREVENRQRKTETTNYRIQLGLNAKLIKGLSYDFKFQYERSEANSNEYYNENTFYVRDIVNFFCDFDAETGTVGKSYVPKGGIKHSSSSLAWNQVFRNQLSYDNTFGKHDITAIAGMEVSKYVTQGQNNPYVFGYNEITNSGQTPYYGQLDEIGNLWGYSFYSYSYYGYLASSFSRREDRYISYYGNASYVYDEKYGASFSIRSDGSNFVSKDASLRWSPMWSAGLRWNISKEKFMEDAKWVDRLTLRATYGINGNAEKSTSPQTLVSTSNSSTTHGIIGSIASYGNPLLKWERTKTFNFGVDFSLFKNMLSGSIDAYNRYSVDVIGDVTIPSAYGTSSQRFNNAEISNRGVELSLTGNFKVKPIGLGIKSTVTFAYNKNKIEKLYNPNLYCYDLVDTSTFVEGKPIGSVYSYEFAGTEDGVPYVIGVDGEKSSFNDLTLHNRTLGLDILKYEGTVIAPYTLGWNWELSWNGLTLSAFITGKFGAVFRAPIQSVPVVGSGKTFVNAQIKMYEKSDGTLYPTWPNEGEIWMYRWDRYMPNLSYFVESADFIKLKELDLSWELPKKWLRKVNVGEASVFMQARDLGCIWRANKYGYDPEWLPGTNKPSTSVSFGLNVKL